MKKASILKKRLSEVPAWSFSCITFVAILWLTLAPHPLGEEPPPLFPGADKIAHAIMFGGLSIMFLFDWQRKHQWTILGIKRMIMSATLSSITGIFIEFAQSSMGLGRGFEYGDIVADIIGAFLFSSLYVVLQKNWVTAS